MVGVNANIDAPLRGIRAHGEASDRKRHRFGIHDIATDRHQTGEDAAPSAFVMPGARRGR